MFESVYSEPPGPLSMRFEAPPADVPTVDVVVIGGGVNGTGVARDLTLRGLRVVLFERNDLAFGASGNSSGMIHGGVRYLSKNPSVTRDSCKDSGFIQAIAPHLLFRIPFIMPVRKGPFASVMYELIDAYFQAYDIFQPLKRGKPHARLSAEECRRLEPGLVGDFVGGITFDEWGVDGSRLCVLNAVDAKERGASIHVHTTVEAITREGDGGHYIVRARDRITGQVQRVRAKSVVNSTGAWGPITAAIGGIHTPKMRLRPGKGIHVAFDRRLSNYAIMSQAIDGRDIFIEPWQNMSVIGTTDDDYYGDLDNVLPTSEEVRYLVQGIARVFPAVREARIVTTWTGVRPTLYTYGKNEDALSREHEIVDHRESGAPGVFSMIGGKLASYRLFAQEQSDVVMSYVGQNEKCVTHVKPLPGGDVVPSAMETADAYGITPTAAQRLTYRHGSRALRILDTLGDQPDDAEIVCPCEPVMACEVKHAVREEFARTVDDVSRRTRLGLGTCGGMRCAFRCAQIVADETDVSPEQGRAMAMTFLERQTKMRIPAMGTPQARQEALLIEQLRGAGVRR